MFCLSGMCLCFYLFGKTVDWVFQPVIRHLEAKEKAAEMEEGYIICEEGEENAELVHDHHLKIENDNIIIHLSKVILKKLNNPVGENRLDDFGR
jgi:hypothetical protein